MLVATSLPRTQQLGLQALEKASITFRKHRERVIFGVEMMERSTCPDQHPHS